MPIGLTLQPLRHKAKPTGGAIRPNYDWISRVLDSLP
jgi:hypothetical protein